MFNMVRIVATDDGETFYGLQGQVLCKNVLKVCTDGDATGNITHFQLQNTDFSDINHRAATYDSHTGDITWSDADPWKEFYWTDDSSSSSSKLWLWILIVVVVVLLIGAGVFFFMRKGEDHHEEEAEMEHHGDAHHNPHSYE